MNNDYVKPMIEKNDITLKLILFENQNEIDELLGIINYTDYEHEITINDD